MFSREFIAHVGNYDEILKYGWGQDIYSAVLCNKNKWGIGVCDLVGVEHLDSITEKKTIGQSKIRQLQMKNMKCFFKKKKIRTKPYYNWAKKYKFEK